MCVGGGRLCVYLMCVCVWGGGGKAVCISDVCVGGGGGGRL